MNSAPAKPPKTLCPACLLRGDRVWMRIGHTCVAEDFCRRCGSWRLKTVLRWNPKQGWLSALVEPCAVCLAEAKRGFQVQ